MAWGDLHEVPYNSKIKERIIGPFSSGQLLWIAPGVLLSFQIAQFLPKLPIENLVFSRIHWAIPFFISLIFATFKDSKTNLTLFQLIRTKSALKRRNRVFYYRRRNMPARKD